MGVNLNSGSSMAGIATHYIPSGRIPSLVARLAELESDEVEVVNMAIEEFVADPPTLKQWKEWTLGGEIRDSIDRCVCMIEKSWSFFFLITSPPPFLTLKKMLQA